MEKLRFLELLYGGLEFYKKGEIQEAYDYLTNHQHQVDGSLGGIYFYRFLFACELKNKELALEILKKSVDDLDLWFPYQTLIYSEIADIFNNDETYQRLVDVCKTREEERKYNGKPHLEIFEPKTEFLSHPKLLIALHGDQQEILGVHDYWNPERFFHHIVAIPEASIVSFSDGHTWSDIKRSLPELKLHYDNLIKEYSIQPKDITICSFSGGTGVVLEAVVNEEIEVKNLIFVAPPLPNLEECKDKLSVLREKGVSVYILCGDLDERFVPVANTFASYLNEANVNYKLHIASNTKHEYPKNFDDVLLDMKEFLNL
ncbi:MAG: hypothetical protein KJ847_07025 [Firmicutes bacterium]|nr:hypothetical protein [Bacillota bacterium]